MIEDKTEGNNLTEHEKHLDFIELVRPLIKYLNEKHHPHTSIIIDTITAEVVCGEYSYHTDEFING